MNPQKKLNVVVFGAGGSGTSVHRELLMNPAVHVDIITGVDDSGGSTGVVTKLLEILLKFVPYDKLAEMGIHYRFYGRPEYVLPFGDIRNNLLRIANYSQNEGLKEVAKLLDTRIPYDEDALEKIRRILRRVFEILGINEFTLELDTFTQAFLSEFFKNQQTILDDMNAESENKFTSLKNLSIGNLLLSFIYLTSESQEVFFERLKQLQLIPENIDFHFLSEVRHVALARDEFGNNHIYEHNIDEATLPMQPMEFYLCPVDSEGEPSTSYGKEGELQYSILQPDEVQPRFENIFHTADVIFASTGSYANLFPQAKLFAQLVKDCEGLIMYVSNFARTKNEVDPQTAIYWLYKILGKEFVTLLVNEDLSLDLFSDRGIRSSYMDQHKFFNAGDATLVFLEDNIPNEVFRRRIFPILNLVNNSEGLVDKTGIQAGKEFIDNGIKHEPKEIADITIFFGIMYRLLDIHDLSRDVKDVMFNLMLSRLGLTSFQNSELQEYVRFLRELAMDEKIEAHRKFDILERFGALLSVEGTDIKALITDFRNNILDNYRLEFR